ncbi:MAG: DUF2330 domain-containing protein [Synechococcales bacterium]|nr:DUF2330 domain-containing protein [Synechococcales bacterium]
MSPTAWAFCGFYVAKADSKLYNQASQVAIARAGNQTVLTMANDYQGEVKDFAIVVPVPVVLKKEQVRVAEPKVMEHLDAFSAPRLVEYFDADPCQPIVLERNMSPSMPAAVPQAEAKARRNEALGVTIEEKFSVGEYDILILSAKESNGLETWLRENGYKIPAGARNLLKPYIRQKMKFFVAKVNLEAFDQSEFTNLRPLQMSYQSPRFMLPIRLGMVNAQQAQDLIVYILSPKGQAETTNYRTVKIPSNTEVPTFVKQEFSDFYKAMFTNTYNREDRKVAFLEYAWDMAGCDPCSADPLSQEELQQLGVFWNNPNMGMGNPGNNPSLRAPMPMNSRVFLTRLHVRYRRDRFPEDLMFQATNNQEFFQGRYVMNHPFTGEMKCEQGKHYQRELPKRFEREAQNLAKLTGWNIGDIRRKLTKVTLSELPWWERLWVQFFG